MEDKTRFAGCVPTCAPGCGAALQIDEHGHPVHPITTTAACTAGIVVPRALPTATTLIAALGVVEAAVAPFAHDELARVTAEKELQVSHAGAAAAAAHRHDDNRVRHPASVATPFHSSALPNLTLAAYARHVANATGYGAEGLAVGIALMARYDRAAAGTASELGGVTPLTMHRLFATSMQLGMKATNDHFIKNGSVASMCGIGLSELNYLEVCLAKSLDYHVLPTAFELCEMPRALAGMMVAIGNGHQGLDVAQVRTALHSRPDHVPPPAPVAAATMHRFSACDGASASSIGRSGHEDGEAASQAHLPDGGSFGGSASDLSPNAPAQCSDALPHSQHKQ